jgi:energy-converting hydrogenase Eha subunit A
MVRNVLNKGIILLLVLVFTAASSTIVATPAVSSNEASASEEVIENSWTQMAPMPTPRSALGVAAVDGKIYAIGGNSWKLEGDTGTNEMYDPVTDTWTTKAPMPTPRAYFGIVAYQNKIYCLGGLSGNSTRTESSWKGCIANEVYDPTTDTWETKAPMPIARWQLKGNVANGKIYLIGGAPNPSLNEVYDPVADNWTTKAPIQYNKTIKYKSYPFQETITYRPGSDAVSAVIDNKIFVIDGELNLMYSPENDSWSLRASPPSYMGTPDATAVTTGVWAPKRIYIFGSDNANVAYDPATDKWTLGKRSLSTREKIGVAVVNDKLYVIGGGYLQYIIISGYIVPSFYSASAVNEQYTPFGYGTVPPAVHVVSPENTNYTSSNVSLAFTVNKPAVWMGFSLDGQDNVTITGNTTLSELSSGLHNVTVYAKDEFENTGASETITFGIVESFPTVLVAVTAVAVAVGSVGVLIYFRKRKH